MIQYVNITLDNIPERFRNAFYYLENKDITVAALNNTDPTNKSVELYYLEHKILYLIHKGLIDAGIYSGANMTLGYEDYVHQMDFVIDSEVASYNNYVTVEYYVRPNLFHTFTIDFGIWFVNEVRNSLATLNLNGMSYVDIQNYNLNLQRYLDKVDSNLMYNTSNLKGLEPKIILTYPDLFSPYRYDPNYVGCKIMLTIDLSTM